MCKCIMWPVFRTSFRFDCFSVSPAFLPRFSENAAFRTRYYSKTNLSNKTCFFLFRDKIAKLESGPDFKKEPVSTHSGMLTGVWHGVDQGLIEKPAKISMRKLRPILRSYFEPLPSLFSEIAIGINSGHAVNTCQVSRSCWLVRVEQMEAMGKE